MATQEHEHQKDERLVWIDLEMTGLDPDVDVILEIATIVTDADLVIVAEGPNLVVSQPAERLERMSDVVRGMHEKNGLLERVLQSSISLREAESRTLAFLRRHCAPHQAPLCGNTIWMDRMFLNRQMPAIDRFLHYRTIDVTSVKELARRWHPAVFAGAPAKLESHRALDDIRASVQELAYYRQAWIGPETARARPDSLDAGRLS